MLSCVKCPQKGIVKRRRTGEILCKKCFCSEFEDEVHETIINGEIFQKGDIVALGASGGKDSTVMISVLKKLNEKHNYGIKLLLLSIDEGIKGYRDDSLKTVEINRDEYELPLKILSYKELYNVTMDEVVSKIGTKHNCSYCGVFRRQALEKGACDLGANIICTGHNADDVAETVLMNILRGDIHRLEKCILPKSANTSSALVRCKPLLYSFEKEIVLYAFYNKLTYFATECKYSKFAYRYFDLYA